MEIKKTTVYRAVIGVGRTIAVFNHFTKEKLTRLAGVDEY